MASIDGHFRSPNRMEIVCNPLSFQGTSFRYSLIQLYLSLVEIRDPYLNLGWMRYVIMHRHNVKQLVLKKTYTVCQNWRLLHGIAAIIIEKNEELKCYSITLTPRN